MGKIFKKILILFSVLFIFTLSIGIYAAGDDEFDSVSTGFVIGDNSRTTIFTGEDHYYPTSAEQNDFPFKNNAQVYDENISGGEKTEYYTTTQISFDRIYGYNKGLIDFKGEIPKEIAIDEKGEPRAEFKDLRYNDYDDGIEFSTKATNFDPKEGYRKLQSLANEETDVRLMAHLKSYANNTILGLDLGGSGITGRIVSLALSLISAIFKVERASLAWLILRLDAGNLGKVINRIFIGDGGTSPFLMFCIIAFIFAVVGAAWQYVKGNGAIDKPREIIIVGLVGMAIIGAALTNKAYLLASPVSNLANRLVETVRSSTVSGAELFTTKLNRGSNIPQLQSMVNSYNQESMLRKAYIDMTIENQFGVSMDDLKIGGDYIKCNLSTLGVTDGKKIDNNLGYYFWYANSGVSSLNTSRSFTVERKQTEKFEKVLNCLQESLDAASNSATKLRIKTMVKSLAGGSANSMTFQKILFAIECVFIAVLLWQFILPVLMSRLELLISTFGLAIAGPLFITNNKKLVGTAKGILAMFVFAFIKITIYELIIMLILYTIGFIMRASSLMSMILTLTLSWMGIKNAPKLAHYLKYKINDMESKFSPELAGARSRARTFGQRRLDQFSRSRAAGTVDKDGNVKMNVLGKLATWGATELNKDGYRNKIADDKNRLDSIKRSYQNAAREVSHDYDALASDYSTLTSEKNSSIKEYIQDNIGSDRVTNYDLENDFKNDFKDLDVEKLNKLKNKEIIANYGNFKLLSKERNGKQLAINTLRKRLTDDSKEYRAMSEEEKNSAKGRALKKRIDDTKKEIADKTHDYNQLSKEIIERKFKLANSIQKYAHDQIDEEYKEREELLDIRKNKIENDIKAGNYVGYDKNLVDKNVSDSKKKLTDNISKYKRVDGTFTLPQQENENISERSKDENEDTKSDRKDSKSDKDINKDSNNKLKFKDKEIIPSQNKEVIESSSKEDENFYEEASSNNRSGNNGEDSHDDKGGNNGEEKIEKPVKKDEVSEEKVKGSQDEQPKVNKQDNINNNEKATVTQDEFNQYEEYVEKQEQPKQHENDKHAETDVRNDEKPSIDRREEKQSDTKQPQDLKQDNDLIRQHEEALQLDNDLRVYEEVEAGKTQVTEANRKSYERAKKYWEEAESYVKEQEEYENRVKLEDMYYRNERADEKLYNDIMNNNLDDYENYVPNNEFDDKDDIK